MRSTSHTLLFTALFSFCTYGIGCGGDTNKKPEMTPTDVVSVNQLQPGKVIGALGKPLGKVVRIKGTMVSGDAMRQKALMGVWLLNITHVDGEALPKMVLMPYRGDALVTQDKLPFETLGYETGEFAGTPAEVFKYQPAIATKGYHYAPVFVVIKQKPKATTTP